MATTNNFWTNSGVRDPKRNFRFRVSFTGAEEDPVLGGGIMWFAKTATKPEVSFTESTHSYLNHTYYWPARTEWNEVSITFVDPADPDVAGSLAQLVERAGYRIPAGVNGPNDFATVSKADSVAALGQVLIEQIDEEGNSLEKWTLNNGWVKSLTFGELDYGNEDLTEVTMTMRYDWASFETPSTPGIPKLFTV
jgi:hypothetical protein